MQQSKPDALIKRNNSRFCRFIFGGWLILWFSSSHSQFKAKWRDCLLFCLWALSGGETSIKSRFFLRKDKKRVLSLIGVVWVQPVPAVQRFSWEMKKKMKIYPMWGDKTLYLNSWDHLAHNRGDGGRHFYFYCLETFASCVIKKNKMSH